MTTVFYELYINLLENYLIINNPFKKEMPPKPVILDYSKKNPSILPVKKLPGQGCGCNK